MKKIMSVMCAMLLLVFACVPAFAAESPQASTFEHVVTVIPTEGGTATYYQESFINENGEQGVHLTPVPNDGYTFDHWVIDGPYKTEGKLTDENLDIVITGDITVTPYYNPASSTTPTQSGTAGTVNVDTSSKSPQTGSSDVLPYAIAVLSVAACGAAALYAVKASRSK